MALAFNDIFRLMSWIFLAALVMVPFCRPLQAAAGRSHGRAICAGVGSGALNTTPGYSQRLT